MLNLSYYKDLFAMNLLNDDETQEIIKIVRAAGFCGVECKACEGEGEGEGGRVGCGVGARGAWNCAQGRRACGLGEASGVAALAGRDAGRTKALALWRWEGGESGYQESIGKS